MRVCPECGEPAGARAFCESCGRNLTGFERLPTREEWEVRQKYERKRTLSPAGDARSPTRSPLTRIALLAAVPVAVIAAVVAVALAGGKSPDVSGVVTRIRVPSPSMTPTLAVGSTVRVVVAQSYVPKVGDIVVLHRPTGADLITRIVAGPGDTIRISDGARITIPHGYYYVLNDNRRASDDSRTSGPVPRAYIIGKVLR